MPGLSRQSNEWQRWLRALDGAGLARRVSAAAAVGDRRLLGEFIRVSAAPQTGWLICAYGDRDAVRYLAEVAGAEGVPLDVRRLPRPWLRAPARRAALAWCEGSQPALALLDAASAAGLPGLGLQVADAERDRVGQLLLSGAVEPALAAARCALIVCGERMAAAWSRAAMRGELTHWALVEGEPATASSAPGERSTAGAQSRLAGRLVAAGVGAALVVGGAGLAWAHRGGSAVGQSTRNLASTVTAEPAAFPGQFFAPSQPRLMDSTAVAADQRNGAVVVFGGAGNDTWTWDGQFWGRMRPDASPPGSAAAAMAFDPGTRRVLLFGGIVGAQTPDGETWTWDGRNWTQLSVTHGPTEGGAALMAYDHTRRQLVLIACCSPDGRTATWGWDGAGWGLLADTAPPTKVGSRLADDPRHSRLMLVASFTGATGIARSWSWDGAAWTEVAAGAGPPESRALQLLEDPLQGGLLEVVPSPSGSGVQTWRWDGSRWAALARAGGPNVLGLGLTPPGTDIPLLLGRGSADDAPVFPWAWSGTQWVEQEAVHLLPDPASEAAYDPVTGGAVAFGGQPSDSETWTWDGHLWTLRRPTTSPPARTAASLSDDPFTHTAVLFGGKLASGDASADTWIWDGNDWAQAHPATSPPPDLLQPMTYDPIHHEVVLVVTCCRTAGGISTEQTWTWDGITWTRHQPASSPPPLLTATMTFDPASQRVLLYGGDDLRAARVSTDTWSWDGLTWTQLHPGTSPDQGGVMVGDPVTSQVVLVTANSAGPDSPPDTWVWDGRTWTPLRSPPATIPYGGTPIYDASSAGVVVFLPAVPIIESWDGRAWSATPL